MLSKKFPIKPKIINFSSEDSQDTDASLNSSIDAVDENAQNTVGNKFNKLRETMNKYFMANPELAEEIRFEQYSIPDDDDQQPNMGGNSPDRGESPDNKRSKRGDDSISIEGRSASQGRGLSRQQTLKIPQEESQVTNLSGASNKLWATFSREMNRGQKNTKAPSLPQITHMLNLFKQTFEKPSVLDNTMTSPKGITGSPRKTYAMQTEKPDFRIQSAKSVKEGGKGKHGKDKKKGEDQNQEDNEEDGVTYFSIRKKKHLQMKHKIRAQYEANREQRMKDREERERLSKEREHKNVMNTLAELDEEVRKGPHNNKENPPRSQTVLEKGDTTGKNKKSSTKQSTNIFDRLTKDTSNRNDFDDNQKTFDKNGKGFLSPFAENLYNEMKAYGNNEGFKRIANMKINAFKREFKEKITAQRKLPTEGLKFTKEDAKYYNTFLPDFDRTAHIQNKDSVFIHNEVIRGSEEWRENPENELLAKFQKMTNGTLFEYWRDAKELNQ